MNSAINKSALFDKLFNGEVSICVFAVNGHHYYVVDDKENFCIDVQPYYQFYLDKGDLTKEQYDESLRTFRCGIPVLTPASFQEYITRTEAVVYQQNWLQEFFLSGFENIKPRDIYESIEKYQCCGGDRHEKWDQLLVRLPSFYVNFDRQIFYHTDWDRLHDEFLPKGWSGKASLDFYFFIPDKIQYWLIDGMNFWKLQI